MSSLSWALTIAEEGVILGAVITINKPKDQCHMFVMLPRTKL
jgi:hypothetical protein